MAYRVVVTEDAERDLEDISDYIAENDSPSKARYVIERIAEAIGLLSSYPNRGNYPKELLESGIREYREVYFKPYRIIYGVRRQTVIVYLVADGRRDMVALLERRLLS